MKVNAREILENPAGRKGIGSGGISIYGFAAASVLNDWRPRNGKAGGWRSGVRFAERTMHSRADAAEYAGQQGFPTVRVSQPLWRVRCAAVWIRPELRPWWGTPAVA